jgi:cell division protein FtsB
VQEEFDKYFVEPVAMEEQNQALVEKNDELAEFIESLKRQNKLLKHEIKVKNQAQKEQP